MKSNLHGVLESRGVKLPEELRPGKTMRWGEEVKMPSAEAMLETLRSIDPSVD